MHKDIMCPKCGSETVIRTAKKGPNTGRSFHVCIYYPECKGKVAIKKPIDTECLIGKTILSNKGNEFHKNVKEKQNAGFFAPEKAGIKKGVVGGIIMMVIATVWFGVAWQYGWIFFYPPILFLIGLYAFIKGIVTGNISGK